MIAEKTALLPISTDEAFGPLGQEFKETIPLHARLTLFGEHRHPLTVWCAPEATPII